MIYAVIYSSQIFSFAFQFCITASTGSEHWLQKLHASKWTTPVSMQIMQ